MSESSFDDVGRVWEVVQKVELPHKKYFKIGEVAQLVGVESHVLRYWQTQFPQVRPQKSRSGHRQYRRKDVETLLAVKELLHVQRFTIAGARQALRAAAKARSQLPTKVGAPVTTARPAAPEVAPPSPLASRTDDDQEVEVVGLDAAALHDAMDAQLASSQGNGARVDVGIASAADLAAEARREPAISGLEAVEVVPANPLAPTPVPASRVQKEQLGFGFSPDAHAAVRAALNEAEAILDVLRRDANEAARALNGPR